MAPASRGNTFAQRSDNQGDGAANGFDLPPSTMAAQLINNLSAPTMPSRQAEQEDLKNLMDEVSNQEASVAGFSNDEAKLEHKHKLIYVFARAVLERLSGDDPFLDIQKMVPQASDALEIFISTIKEIPEVLIYCVKPKTELLSRSQEPLWFWLFPRVLALLGRRQCDALAEKIKQFFHVCFEEVARSPKLWNQSSFFFCYFKECVTTMLNHLQITSMLSHNTTADVCLPIDEVNQSMFSHESHSSSSTMVPNCTYRVRTTPECVCHVASILSILVDISMAAAASYDPTPAYQDYMAWMLDSFLATHEQTKKLQAEPFLGEACRKSDMASFSSLQALLLSESRMTLRTAIVRKGYTILSNLCADLIENIDDLAEQPLLLSVCSSLLNLAAMCRDHDFMHRAVSLHLVPTIQITLNDDNKRSSLGKDFQKAAVTLLQECQVDVPKPLDLSFAENFDSAELNGEFRHMGLEIIHQEELAQVPPAKRRKIRTEIDILEEVTTKLFLLLGSQIAMDLDGLDQVAESCFAELSNEGRCRAFEYLGMLPCAANRSLSVMRDNEGNISSWTCFICDGTPPPTTIVLDSERCQNVCGDAVLTFAKLIKLSAFAEAQQPRVHAMVVLKKYATHFNEAEFMDLKSSSLGQWCVASLKSSSRELRISAGRTLTGFLSNATVSEDIIHRNREMVLELLRSISDKVQIHLQETWILTWGQIGRVLNDDGLGLVLLRLVEFLGHANPLISAVAFNEIMKLATAKKLTPERLFNPFWDDVAIAAVKGLLVRPQTTQLMADILGMSVPNFLLQTQSSTLPHLVLSGQIDVIARIAQARGESEAFITCMEPSNFASILALLIVQNIPDIEALTTSLLRAVSPRFKDMDFIDWMRTEPAVLGLRLLKIAGQAHDNMKSRVHLAFRLLASSSHPATEKNDAVGAFLQQHILGFMARFGEVVNDVQNQYSVIEKIRCIKGVEEMVKIGKKVIKVARPQVCAFLQQALAQPELQSVAFSAWDKMLHNLNDDDVELMLESTFSTIIQRWESFNEATRQRAEDTLQYLLKHRARLIRNMITNLPSLSQFSQLQGVEKLLNKVRTPTDVVNSFQIFSRRVGHENSGVVAQALVELKAYLRTNQSFLQASAVSEQPDAVVGLLVRSILDACVKFNEAHHDIAQLSAECIGLIGCLDPNRVESVREQSEMVVVSNFEDPSETTDFVLYMLKEVIVKAFLSTTDTGVQGFLSLVMQKLLEVCNFKEVCPPRIMNGEGKDSPNHVFQKWLALPGSVQETLTPFLSSRFTVKEMDKPKVEYPIFRLENVRFDKIYRHWLSTFVLELLYKPYNTFAELVFPPLRRAIKIRNLSIASFLLPYAVLHVIVDGTNQDREEIVNELLGVLQYQQPSAFKIQEEDLKMCSEAVFQVLDYLSRWVQAKQLEASKSRASSTAEEKILLVRSVLDLIPAELVSQRAIECRSYSRALFYWEQHIRHVRDLHTNPKAGNVVLQRLQDIYAQIDEPDGIEGISAHLHVLDIDQQILAHRKAGRWTAAQSWYEIKLAETPDDADVQVNLLTCLKESGQHDVLLNYVQGMHTATKTVSKLLPFATEASWATGRWAALERYSRLAADINGEDFNISIGRALLALHRKDFAQFTTCVRTLREQIACSLTTATTPSLGACHDEMLKFHVLTELEMIAGTGSPDIGREKVLESLNRRLEVVGAYLNDKQYLLGIRRAAMQLSSLNFTEHDLAGAWLSSARLARKGNAMHQSFNAVLHASKLGHESAMIEHARLLMKEGHHRKAIQSLQGVIANNAFIGHNKGSEATSFTNVELAEQQNLLTARAHLLYAKWLDSAGQTHSSALRSQYQLAARTHNEWEKGHYYLGRHYNKLLESEKALAPEHQAESYLTGETAKLVIENYLRSLLWGTKYIYQTLPRILTLWLDLGSQINQPLDPKYGVSREFVSRILRGRKEQLGALHSRFNKYIVKLPAYVFYTALPQIVSRITHPNNEVYKFLNSIIVKVVSTHPQQALWSLLAVATSTQTDRKTRGITILQQLRSVPSKKQENSGLDIRVMIKSGERLTSELLQVCVAGEFQGNRTSRASLTKDLGFNHKSCTPNLLAVPFEAVLMATLPTLTDKIQEHKAFSRDVVTIDSFLDEVLILSSLQKPRKLTARGSDGKEYGLLCKPKDDLRKDQRLMEFNSMINRSMKRDAESSKRQLYIKTYAVTPLNEECGIIEWVDGLKTLRDILLGLYRPLGIAPDYKEIERFCEEALKGDDKMPFFTEKVLGRFPPIFHQWFVQQFPEPSAWFTARLRYTRSCAVMSMVGTILGLGDRHGENILFEEGNGGTFHVDFNCLFDKGLTFVKPERVPFRLTHNMIDAMGIYGYEGPFRKSSELTLKLLRQHEETLMTILEAFVYDPTLDLVKKDHKKKKEGSVAGPQTAQGVLDAIQRKVKGLLPGESVPLGVEGQVDELIGQATDLKFLAGMYIGWCSFF